MKFIQNCILSSKFINSKDLNNYLQNKVNATCVLKIEASSAGLEDGNYFRIEINDVSYTSHAQGRGLNFLEIDAISGQIYGTQHFDTHSNTAFTDNMVNYINLLEPGIIVVVGAVDEASGQMTASGYSALYSLGMTQGLQFGYRDSYVLIGGKDLKSTGQAVNQYKPKLQGEAYVSKCIRDSISTDCSNYIHVVSGGQLDYERFSYYVNHQYKPLPSDVQYGRGLFIVVFDKEDASIVKNVQSYDTYGVQADETNLITLINNITNGDHVLIGAMDSVETYLSSNFYSSIQSIGGPSSLSIGHRESFAIIGRKGDSVGTAIWKKNTIGNGGVIVEKCLQGCSYQCATCSGHKDNCDSCSRSTGINQKPNCNCAIKFYEQSQSECSACLNKCAECVNNSQCTVCTGVGRQSSIPNCSCLPGYYETGVNQTDCGKCDYPCGNCFGTSTSCTDCSTVDYRKDTSTCQCLDNYYDDNTECLNCIYPCKKCSSSSQCITCHTTDHRVSITDCRCQSNYLDNGSSCEQCDYPCYNCSGTANQCDSCIVDDNRSNSHPCSCNSGYFDNGSNCQKCHYKCNECTDFDTCKPNQCSDSTRDPLSNCICKEGFFDEGVSLCSQCSYKCKACSGNANNCDECATGLGRTLALKPNCDCLPTYFDNGNQQADCVACIHPCINCQSLTICDSCVEREFSNDIDTCTCLTGYYELQNLECQICQHQCKTCVNSSENCLVCIEGNNRYDQPNCQCKDRFYEDSNKMCQPCVYPCLKCTQANFCIDCKTTSNRNLPPLDNSTCKCSDGFYDTGSQCDFCDGNCNTCVNFANNCDSCKGDRINIPDCNCPDHKYDDFTSLNCIECDITCIDCLLNGCQTCVANRQKVLSSDQECVCPPGGIDHTPDTYYCTTCDVAVLNNVFSNDYLYISISFFIDVEIVGYDEDITIFTNDLCLYLLTNETIAQLGIQPQCKQQNLQDIKIKLGAAPSIQVDDDINLNINKIKGTSCGQNFSSAILLSVNLSDTPLPPSVVLKGPTSAVSICENIQITIGQIINDGYRGLIEFQWSLYDSDDNNTSNLESILSTSFDNYIELPPLTFNEHKQYFIQMQFKNHFGMIGVSTFEINTLSKSGVSVLIQQTEPFVFKNYKQISFYSEFKFLDCSSGVTQEQDKELQIQWIRIDQTSQEEILEQYLSQSTDRTSELQIQQYEHIPGDTYDIKIQIQVPNQNLDTFYVSQYKIEIAPLMVYIEGGNRMNAYASPLEISGVAKDPNVQKEIQTDGITKVWSCQNMNNQQNCQQIDNSPVTFQNGLQQSYPKKVFEPYNALLFTLEGEKNTIIEKGQAVIIIVETNLPVLAVQVPESFLSEKLNKNDDLQIDISFDGNVDEVFFSLIFLYDFEVVATKSFDYNSFAFSIWDLFDNFQNGINELLIRVSMYDPQYFMPSQTSYNINVNSPPINGSITVTPLQGLPLQTEFTIKLENYFDEDSPLSYKFQYYTNINNYQKEKVSGKNPTSAQKNVLTDFQSQNSLLTILPQADINEDTNTYDLLIMVSVSDSLGGITNVTQIVQIEPQINDSLDQQINTIDTKFQQSQTQDNNIMVQQLNLICVQIDQLEKQNESFKSSTQLKNIKLQIYDKLNSIKNQIPSKVMQDQTIKSMNLLMEDSDLIIQKDNSSISSTFESIELMIQNKKDELQNIQNSGQIKKGDNKITRKNDQANLLLGKQLQFMNQFSQAFDVAKNIGSNRRILSDQDIQQNQLKLLDMTKQINQALQITTLPNQDAVNFQGSSFKQSVQKNTHKKVLQKYFKDYETLNGFEQQSESLTFDGESQDNSGNQDKIFNTSTQIFKNNILKDTPKFPYPDQSNQLYDIDIFSTEDQSKQITVHDNLSLSFGKKDQEKNQICISQVQNADDWDSNACKNVEHEDPSGETYLKCECKTLSPVTIIADIQNIFENSTLSEAFSNEGIQALSNFKFWLSIIFYFFVFQTGVLIVFIIYGYKQDKIDANKKMDQKNKNLEKNIKENIQIEQKELSEDINKNLTNENKNSSFDEKEINTQKKRKLRRKQRKPNQNQVQPYNQQFALTMSETDRSQNTPDQLNDKQQLQQPILDIININNDDHMANSKDELKPEDKLDSNTYKIQQSQIFTPDGKFQQRKSFFSQTGQQTQNNFNNEQEQKDKEKNNNDNQLNENDKDNLLQDNDQKLQILEEKIQDNDNISQNTNIAIRKRKFKNGRQSKFQDLAIEEPESEIQDIDQNLERKIEESSKNQNQNLNNEINMNENIEIIDQKNITENSENQKKQTLQNEFLEDKFYKNEEQSNDIQKESLSQEQQELKTKEEIQLQKEKEQLIKRKQIINFVLRIHEFIGIYYQYDEKLSRPVRYSCFYLKICIILAFTSSFITEESTQYMSVLISVTTSILSGIPLAILKKLLSSNIVLKIIGFILYIGCLLVSVFLMITNAALMGVSQSNQWTYAYISSFFIDVFFFQILLSFIKLILFNWSIGKQGCAIFIRKVLSLEKGIDKYFKKKGGLQNNENQNDIIDYEDISF